MQNGKGDSRRQSLVSQKTWDDNYNRIFKKDKNVKTKKVKRQ